MVPGFRSCDVIIETIYAYLWKRMTRQWIIVGLALSVLFVASGAAIQQQLTEQDTQIATTTSDGEVTDDVSLVPDEALENPDQQTPIFRSGINYVRVDATVTDQEGNPVLDLTDRQTSCRERV